MTRAKHREESTHEKIKRLIEMHKVEVQYSCTGTDIFRHADIYWEVQFFFLGAPIFVTCKLSTLSYIHVERTKHTQASNQNKKYCTYSTRISEAYFKLEFCRTFSSLFLCSLNSMDFFLQNFCNVLIFSTSNLSWSNTNRKKNNIRRYLLKRVRCVFSVHSFHVSKMEDNGIK